MNELFETIAKKAELADPPKESDYVNEADGLVYCGSCHSPKQCRITLGGRETVVWCICSCEKAKQEREKALREAEQREEYRRRCFSVSRLISATFENDDGKDPELFKVCRKYAEKFNGSSDWLLLYGGCGTGKSYAAACICNELISRGLSVRFITLSQIERDLWDSDSKAEVYSRLDSCDLLCIDDFGAERDSDYMKEIIFNVIDDRLSSGKPAVITTNLSGADFSSPNSISANRIYSRIFERSIPYHVKGEDRRLKEIQKTGKQRLNALLNG